MRMMFALIAALAASPALADAREPILLRDMGSFHVGGRLVEIDRPADQGDRVHARRRARQARSERRVSGRADVCAVLPGAEPQGQAAAADVARRRPLRRHLRDQAGRRPGWLNYFLRKGWDTYVSDAMERGRSGWTDKFKGDPVFLPLGDPWERFRVGPLGSWNEDKAKRTTYPGVQFPIDAYEQFMKQGVPRWVTTDEQIIAAYIELVDKVCPCVVLVHSQAGSFGFKVAEARPDKIKALIAVEPAAPGSKDKVATLKGIPIAVIYGDNAREHPRWARSAATSSAIPTPSRAPEAAST